MAIALRPAGPADEAFQFQVYASTRAEEMALVPWSAEEKQAFLAMQFSAQRQGYAAQFPDANWQIILQGGAPIGRLIVDRSEEEIRFIDIALLPEHRGRGIGTPLIRGLQEEAAQAGRPLRLHVETFSRALGLYRRLGFQTIGEHGIYLEMEWRCGALEAGQRLAP